VIAHVAASSRGCEARIAPRTRGAIRSAKFVRRNKSHDPETRIKTIQTGGTHEYRSARLLGGRRGGRHPVGTAATARAYGAFSPQPGAWRRFELRTRVEIVNAAGTTQARIPVPSLNEADWFRTEGSKWTTNSRSAALVREPKYGAEMLHIAWGADQKAPVVEVISRIAKRDRAIDFGKPGGAAMLSEAQRAPYTEGTALVPVGGLVRQTSDKIVAGLDSGTDKARAIYEWIVENTFRDAKVRGCGRGDIAAMLTLNRCGRLPTRHLSSMMWLL